MAGMDSKAKRFSFFVPGVPVAQPRQRHRVVSSGGRSFTSNYTPKSDPVNAFKATVRLAWQECAGEMAPLTGPIWLELRFVFPRPKSQTRKLNSEDPKTTKPDLDNLAKSFSDALNGFAWLDDSQVCDLFARKRIAGDGSSVGVNVTVVALGNEQ